MSNELILDPSGGLTHPDICIMITGRVLWDYLCVCSCYSVSKAVFSCVSKASILLT